MENPKSPLNLTPKTSGGVSSISGGCRRIGLFAATVTFGLMLATGAQAGTDVDRAAKRQALLDQYDANGNGRIDGEEAAQINYDQRMERRKARLAANYARYAKYDLNGDGVFSDEEIEAMRKARHSERMAVKYDLDGDGKLSREEFEKARLAMLDRDGDGVISEAEKQYRVDYLHDRDSQRLFGSDLWVIMVSKYDKNGDGVLSGLEQEDMLKGENIDDSGGLETLVDEIKRLRAQYLS